METSELVLPGIVFALIIVMVAVGLWKKVIAKLGLRNFFRHKSHSIISIAGLLVGTSIICASMVVGDSIEYFIVEETYNRLGEVDITVTSEGDAFFDYSVYSSLASDTVIQGSIDGISPMLAAGAVARSPGSGQFEPSVNLIGFDADIDREFGAFTTLSGSEIYGEDLTVADAIINEALAENLNVSVDDMISVTYSVGGNALAGTGQFAESMFTVRYVVQDVGKALYSPSVAQQMTMQMGVSETMNVFVNLDTAQQLLNQTGMINIIKVSNIGGVEDGAEGSVELAVTIDNVLDGIPGTAGLNANTEKQDHLDIAQTFNELISMFLTIFGSFAIMAGVILIINIFTMLAEERKSELGMARAVGMKRRHLMQSFLFEGLAYGSVAAVMGVIVGLGIGVLLIYMVNNFIDLINVQLPFHFELFSLVRAFSLGFVITFVTILLTSWRISKLNIIRAIRGIDEPPKDRKSLLTPILGVLLAVISFAAIYKAPENVTVMLLAPSGLLTGVMMALWRWIGDRIAITASSLGVFLWTFYAIRTYFVDLEPGEGDFLFIVSGILSVLSIVLLVMYNSRPVIRLITGTFGRVRKFRPTILTAVSYPLTKKFRTGMSVAMFALVIYMIAMLSVFSNMFVIDIDDETFRQGGGFDIQCNSMIPVADIQNISYYDPVYNLTIPINTPVLDNVSVVQISMGFTTKVNVTDEGGEIESPLGFDLPMFEGSLVYGVDNEFATNSQYQFTKISDDYANVNEVWQAVVEPGSRKVVVNGFSSFMIGADVGTNVRVVTNPITGNYSDEYEIIGIMDQDQMTGIFMSKENMMLNFYVNVNQIFLFSVNDGIDIEAAAMDIERDFSIIGMNSMIMREVAEQSMEMMNSMFTLFEIYLDMGMVVGVAGLGVITVRSVVERTPEIGILRSLGFKRKNIRNAFLIEILFVATIGVIIGIFSGVLVAHEIFNVMVADMGQNIQFSIPWMKMGTVVAIAYVTTMLCTIIPAHNASKIQPAEALRYVG